MDVQKIATVIPVDDLHAAVGRWKALLGAEPTFVDGDRWAQFDVAGARIALAGTDRTSNRTGLMLKVTDLEAARAAAEALGLAVGSAEEGPHEVRALVEGPDGVPLTLYAPLGD
jgi:hypothetical protein